MIAPDLGPVWRENPEQIVEAYATWSAQKRSRKALVVYDTMWGSTAEMARAVGEGISSGGCPVRLMPLNGSHRSDVATELLDAGALLIGSPTINGQMYPTVADLLSYVKGLKPKNLLGAVFGSYGWSGEAVRQVEEIFDSMGVELAVESQRTVFVPDQDVLARCRQLGADVAQKLTDRV